MKTCAVCQHEKRIEIEMALMRLHSNKAEEELLQLSEEYDVPVVDLQMHMITHTPLHEIVLDDSTSETSIARQQKLRELDILAATSQEYFSTLFAVGRRIKKNAADMESNMFEKALTKPLVDLYIGCGSEIRNNIRAISDINVLLNGPKENNSAGLQALAAAITNSGAGVGK